MAGQKPRICYILPRFDPATSSHFFHLYEMINLASRSLDIRLILERSSRSTLTLSVSGYRQRFAFPPLRFLELLFVLIGERLSGRRFFYTHYSFYGAFVSWLVTRLLGGTAYYWNCGMPWLYRRSFFEEAVFRFILRHTILVTGTAGLAEEYARRYTLDSSHIRVMSNWIDLSRFEDGRDRKHFRERLGVPVDAEMVLFVHRLSRRKGVHLLPEIMAEVTKRNRNVIFVIVGSGPEEESLRFKVKSLKLEPYVRLVGEVPHRGIPVYFHAADIFLMPSEEEGFPHVLLEAQASGVPYVASDVGGVREITPPELEPSVVAGGDVGGLTAKLSELLFLSERERARISAVGQEWVKQYDIKAVLPKFLELFQH